MYNQLTTPPSSIATSKSPDSSPTNSSRRRRNRPQSPKPYERQTAPIVDDNGSSDDELRAPPRIPPVIKNLSYSVKCAKSQLTGKRSSLNASDVEDDCQESGSQEIFKNGLRFVSIQMVTQAIVAHQAKREWQRVLALATAWEVEADVQRAMFSQLVLQQNATEYARTSTETKFLKNLLARRSDVERGADTEAKKKRYQREVLAFGTADSQLDHVESIARHLCQLEKDAAADDYIMNDNLKAPKYELDVRQASGSKPKSGG
ncbi:hypothetical protein EDD22DRAFT_849487 [Suillus occidentalis]|nr:hypothetical protein EDD22DRAFT_849487 [Suillus occidentalis]